jgi:uncharacterized protein YecE (DUF72 family)
MLTKNMSKPEHERLATCDLATGLFVDVSQAVQRRPWAYGVKTIHTNTLLYSFESDCVLSSWMLLRLHGFPSKMNTDVSEAQLQALAGEAWSLPCAGSAIYAFFLNSRGPWWVS